MLGQLAGTAKQCFSKKRSAHGPRVRSPVSFSGERFLSNVQSDSTTPEIIKQAAERKKIQPRRSVLRIVSELSATFTLPGCGRVARHPPRISGKRQRSFHFVPADASIRSPRGAPFSARLIGL
jgi:hypothetical protein